MQEGKTNQNQLWMETEAQAQQRIEQARRLKQLARDGGLKFEAFLPGELAVWVLDMIEQGVFIDPSEAVFVYMGQAMDIEPHDDLKTGILKRRLESSMKDVDEGRTYTSEEVWEHIEERMRNRVESAVWKKLSSSD